jgi:lipase maturation factor 1
MDWKPASVVHWLFDSQHGSRDRLLSRWLFLRALGLIYFSAFFSLLFQIRGLIGPAGVLPATNYLQAVSSSAGHAKYWYAPTLLWFSASSPMLMGLCWVGLVAAVLVTLNLWPRGTLLVCFVCFISFVTAAGEFSGYQSDGMLLEAGFISLFFAPPGFRPKLGGAHPVMRASLFLLLWEWFRIYFESGVAKMASGDPEWRHFTAMDEYYQNGPLPTWIGWYVQHFPHWFHVASACGTLALELVVVWMLFLPRRWRIILFFIVTPWQIGIILTANYTFLNYLVLVLGFLLLDDRFLRQFVPRRWKEHFPQPIEALTQSEAAPFDSQSILGADTGGAHTSAAQEAEVGRAASWRDRLVRQLGFLRVSLVSVIFLWLFYASTVQMIWMIVPGFPFPATPIAALEPFRIADRYGLFAYMTRGRYEIEFQGSMDGQDWVSYPFRFKPQDPSKPPGIYAPYQPRFDWNLWFASLGGWRANPIVPSTEVKLLAGEPDVLSLFAGNPFPNGPPHQIRAMLWQYWFSTPEERRTQGLWWRRELVGLYAPQLEREPDGKIAVIEWPTALPQRE